MSRHVEYTFDLGDLGEHFGEAQGNVKEDEFGRIRVEIVAATIRLVSADGLSVNNLNALPFLDTVSRISICEKLEAAFIVEKSHRKSNWNAS